MCETNIVALHDQTPQVSLPDPPFLRSRRHSRHDDVFCLATQKTSPLLLLSLKRVVTKEEM
jgi:hypothetical protein